jgi:peptidyl-prolyl cis-trans isomerase B (cyclophilin B)
MFGRKELKNYNATAEELASYQWAKMTTSKGVMWLKLYNDETPNTVANFAALVNDGFLQRPEFSPCYPRIYGAGGMPSRDRHRRTGLGDPVRNGA